MSVQWLKHILLLAILVNLAGARENRIPIDLKKNSIVMVKMSQILCQARIKVLFVYFENQTSHEHTGQILKEVTKNQNTPLEAVKDDGILMYMVMIITNISQPLELSLIRKKSAAKHRSHVFLLVRDADTVSDAWMRASFRQFWKIWLLNIVILYWRDGRLNAYRYNPFMDNYLIPVDNKPNEVPTLEQLFPKTIPNMQRKPLRMCIYRDDVRAIFWRQGIILGTDGLLAAYVAERLNATMMITRPHSYNNHNLSSDICFLEVAKEYVDVAMNIRFLVPDTFRKQAESTVSHTRDDLCVIVPKAKTAPTFWNIFRSFGALVWALILVSVLVANVFCYILKSEVGRVPMQLFAGALTMPMTRIPLNHSIRLFLIFWLYFGLLICSAFKGNLTSMMVFQPYLPDINQLGALARSHYHIIIRPKHVKHIQHFLTLGHKHESRIREQMLEVSDTQMYEMMRNNDIRFAYLEKYHIARFQVNSRVHMHLGRPLFHLMNSCLVPFHAVYIVPYGSPYLGFLNWLIRSSHEFGFERYWDRIMNSAFIKSGVKVVNRRRGSGNDEPVVLKLQHFHAVFALWLVGIGMACIVLAWEHLTHNYNLAVTKRRH
ncbi:GD18575 [Drosophila simulans]|uniref:GD18575 n=1 Tax=Drosophila simulans TaxID=7240 RepID=B4QXX3_DROSI|nr:GD18575 [Drosophila simulans]